MRPAIELRGLGKRYRKHEESPTLLRALVPLGGSGRNEVWALRDIDLEVAQGETVAVIGRNGAGKTTLLRLLAGVTRPTVGRVRVNGRIGPLISLGVGFHEEMTGRENVLVNGMLLGLGAKEVLQRFDQIVEFAELTEFIDTPVKFYSAGMEMRLAFAVIAHADPTVLLVDEVLAVGDARFQRKCFDRLRVFQRRGATILMVSHSTYMIRELCERGVVIRHGRLEYDGDLERAIATYEQKLVGAAETTGFTPVEIIERGFAQGEADWHNVAYDEPIELILRLRFNERVEDPLIAVGATTNAGMFAGFNATPPGLAWRTFERGEESTVRIIFPARFGGGMYRLLVDVKDRAGTETLARSDALILRVAGREGSTGLSDVLAEVELNGHAVLGPTPSR